MIALIDYGAGNLTSVRKGLAAAGIDYFTPADPDEIRKLSGLVIPGVGHFSATRAITAAWRMSILGVVECGIPLLGICLGMQYLFEGSEEAPGVPGLGLIPGTCRLIPSIVKVPHVGWNDLTIRKPSRLATTEYGGTFAAVAERGNIFGVQFHPEKSSEAGLRILRSFATISKSPHFQISK